MIRSLAILVVISIGLINCEPAPNAEELTRDMVVQTEFDNTINFSSFSTYTLPIDTIGLIANSTSDTLIVSEYSKKVTAEIQLNMDSRGYTYVPANQNPDIGINAFIVSDFNIYQTVRYPSYYGGYYSPYYGYYYPVVNTYASSSAILIIQLVDFSQVTAQGQFKVIWNCYIGDVLASPDITKKSVEAISQAFLQTQSLGK